LGINAKGLAQHASIGSWIENIIRFAQQTCRSGGALVDLAVEDGGITAFTIAVQVLADWALLASKNLIVK
jgi:hypothetical protein